MERLDAAPNWKARSRDADHGLVGEGACTATEENKEVESSDDDLLRLEHPEGEVSQCATPEIWVTRHHPRSCKRSRMRSTIGSLRWP